jgi:hypothetical protein
MLCVYTFFDLICLDPRYRQDLLGQCRPNSMRGVPYLLSISSLSSSNKPWLMPHDTLVIENSVALCQQTLSFCVRYPLLSSAWDSDHCHCTKQRRKIGSLVRS